MSALTITCELYNTASLKGAKVCSSEPTVVCHDVISKGNTCLTHLNSRLIVHLTKYTGSSGAMTADAITSTVWQQTVTVSPTALIRPNAQEMPAAMPEPATCWWMPG